MLSHASIPTHGSHLHLLPPLELLEGKLHLAVAASTNNSRPIGTKRKLAACWGGSVPDLDGEIFLPSLLQELGQEMVEPLGSVYAGKGGGADGVGHLVPVASFPLQRAGTLSCWAQASFFTA